MPVTGLGDWALNNIAKIDAARAKFDAGAVRKDRKIAIRSALAGAGHGVAAGERKRFGA